MEDLRIRLNLSTNTIILRRTQREGLGFLLISIRRRLTSSHCQELSPRMLNFQPKIQGRQRGQLILKTKPLASISCRDPLQSPRTTTVDHPSPPPQGIFTAFCYPFIYLLHKTLLRLQKKTRYLTLITETRTFSNQREKRNSPIDIKIFIRSLRHNIQVIKLAQKSRINLLMYTTATTIKSLTRLRSNEMRRWWKHVIK